MSGRWAAAGLAVLLVLGVAGSVEWSARVQHGVELEPVELQLAAGAKREVRLVNHEREMVAFGFRLRYDPAVVELADAGPEERSILEGGNALVLPPSRSPGVLEVRAVAVTGGRMLKPSRPLYTFTVRAVRPGLATLAVEEFPYVDFGDARHSVPVAPAQVTVGGP